MSSQRKVWPKMTHHMLRTRTPFRDVIALAGTEQSIILLVLRIIEKQTRNLTRKPLSIWLGWYTWTDEAFEPSPQFVLSNGVPSPFEWFKIPCDNSPLSSDCGTLFLANSTSDFIQNVQDSCTTHKSTKVPTRHKHAMMMQTTLYNEGMLIFKQNCFFTNYRKQDILHIKVAQNIIIMTQQVTTTTV